MKRLLIGFLEIAVLGAWSAIQPANAETVLKMATFLPKDDVNLTAWWAYVDEVNKKSNGEVVIKFVGGPEAIPAFKQFEAVRSGVVDMIFGCESYYGASVTGGAYIHLSQLTPMEERKVGYYDLIMDFLKKQNGTNFSKYIAS